jgi:hypothetical protein
MSSTTSRVAATLGEVATDGALRAERGLSGLVGEEIRIRHPPGSGGYQSRRM